MSIYHDRGGAGKIANILFNSLLEREHEVLFLYGFENGGFQKTHTSNIRGVSNCSIFTPFLNFLFHKFIGIDIFKSKTRQLKKNIEWADVIHLHVIHSHGFNYRQIFSLLIASNKKVVITNHDSWYYTGRCAIRGECETWKKGCVVCEFKYQYPSSLLDFAHSEFKTKTDMINKINNLTLVSPSSWIAEDLKVVYPNKSVLQIRNGIETKAFHRKINKLENSNESTAEKPLKVLFVTTDFREKVKVDLSVIEYLIEKEIDIRLVGKNSPFRGDRVQNFGYVSEKQALIETMFESDVLLFFSKIDNFPTTVIEACCAGMYVAAYPSKGIAEILEPIGDRYCYFKTPEDLVHLLSCPSRVAKIRNKKNRIESSNRAQVFFSKENMIEDYLNILL